MPLPFAPLVGLALGAFFAWLARAELARDDAPVWTSRPMLLVAAFALAVYAPIVGYFCAFHGDWAYLYAVPWRSVPSALDLAIVLVSAAAVAGGFAAAARAARARRLALVGAIGGAPAAAVLVMAAVFQKRLATSGTYVQFRGGFGTEPIASSALGPAVLWMGFVGALGVAWCGWNLVKKSRAKP